MFFQTAPSDVFPLTDPDIRFAANVVEDAREARGSPGKAHVHADIHRLGLLPAFSYRRSNASRKIPLYSERLTDIGGTR